MQLYLLPTRPYLLEECSRGDGLPVGNTLAHVNARAGPINTNNQLVVGGLDDGPKLGNPWLNGKDISSRLLMFIS